ncbi:MAG: response regulator [Cyanothece sp. SIO1E1]|nr:response regulator [Cyanothece sp. SIO1E1]
MSDQLAILIVAYNPRNLELLAQLLGKAGYKVLQASRLESFEQILTTKPTFQVALIDISGFNPRIWDGCKRLQHTRIPFLIISPHASTVIERQSLGSGARSVLLKPLAIENLLGLIDSLFAEHP